jgi:FAD:protein FMN transferase
VSKKKTLPSTILADKTTVEKPVRIFRLAFSVCEEVEVIRLGVAVRRAGFHLHLQVMGAIAFLAFFSNWVVGQTIQSFSGPTMGTTYNISVVHPYREIDVVALKTQVDAYLAEFDTRMSTYRDDSELTRFNQSNSLEWFPVSEETAAVVQLALRFSVESEGDFDVTVLPLVELWGMGGKNKGNRITIPSEAEISNALSKVGSQHLHARMEPPAIKKDIPELTVDLSAIAPGYAVDELSLILKKNGIASFLVEVGGEVRAGDAKPNGEKWRVGIEFPDDSVKKLSHIAELENQALATSGNYRNFLEVDGVQYSHTINPKTGMAVSKSKHEFTIGSVTVISKDCATADAMATAAVVKGWNRGAEFLQRHGEEFLFLSDKNAQTLHVSHEFPSAPIEQKPRASSSWMILVAGAAVFLLAVLAMSIGALIGRKPIQGSCGGLSAMPGNASSPCELCNNRTENCKTRQSMASHGAAADSESVADDEEVDNPAAKSHSH